GARVDRPRHNVRVGAGQRPDAGAGFLEHAEVAVLRGGTDLRHVEARVGRPAQAERVARAERDDVAGDRGARSQLEDVRAAGEGDRTGARHPVAGEAAGDGAAVDDREARADDAGAARAIAAVPGAPGPTCAAIASTDGVGVGEGYAARG